MLSVDLGLYIRTSLPVSVFVNNNLIKLTEQHRKSHQNNA